jgi:signal peptidase
VTTVLARDREETADGQPWPAWAVRTTARAVLWLLVSLLLWSVVPGLAGWPSRVVVSGSMSPLLRVGDVVVAQPLGDEAVRAGQVLVFRDPVGTGRDIVHRVVEVRADGSYVTKGDANPSADLRTVTRSEVRGVARVKVPLVGLPRVWVREHDVRALLALVALLLGCVLAAIDWRGAPAGPTR